jgi:hypothetical protein
VQVDRDCHAHIHSDGRLVGSGNCGGENTMSGIHASTSIMIRRRRIFMTQIFIGFHYFIILTDDFIIYGYIYLMRHKSESFKKLKKFRMKYKMTTVLHELWHPHRPQSSLATMGSP